MITIRRTDERGQADHGWLDARHSFSFAGYFDPDHMGFGPLRVLNEDRVAPGRGFSEHPHQDMEIVTVIIEGALEHRDSLGMRSVIRPGDVQIMSAGSGVRHSEFNASKVDPVHLLQIWIEPTEAGGLPRYDEAHFAPDAAKGSLRCVVSDDGRGESLRIGQDASIHLGRGDANASMVHALTAGRAAWVQVIAGTVDVNGQRLAAGDAAAIKDEPEVLLAGQDGNFEVLLLDVSAG